MYDYSLGRWLQRDPKGYKDGMDLYEYVRSTPCAAVDPEGLTMTLKNPRKSDYASNEDFQKALKYKARIDKTISHASNAGVRNRLKKEIKDKLDAGDQKGADALGRQLAALSLIKWARETDVIDITVEFVPQIEGGYAGTMNTDSLRKTKTDNSVTMTLATQGDYSQTDISCYFFHETLHGFYAAETYRNFDIPKGLPELDMFNKALGAYKVHDFTFPMKMGEDYVKAIEAIRSGKYKGKSLSPDPVLEVATEGFERVVRDVTTMFARPYFSRVNLDAAEDKQP